MRCIVYDLDTDVLIIIGEAQSKDRLAPGLARRQLIHAYRRGLSARRQPGRPCAHRIAHDPSRVRLRPSLVCSGDRVQREGNLKSSLPPWGLWPSGPQSHATRQQGGQIRAEARRDGAGPRYERGTDYQTGLDPAEPAVSPSLTPRRGASIRSHSSRAIRCPSATSTFTMASVALGATAPLSMTLAQQGTATVMVAATDTRGSGGRRGQVAAARSERGPLVGCQGASLFLTQRPSSGM